MRRRRDLHPLVQGGTLAPGTLVQLEAPEEGLRAVAAAASGRRMVVLWADGALRVYGQPWEVSWQYDNTRLYADGARPAAGKTGQHGGFV